MLKVTLVMPGGAPKMLMIGLTFAELDSLREGSGKVFAGIEGAPIDVSHDVLIFAGEDAAHLGAIVEATGAEFTADSHVSMPDGMKN